jgi:hypothetical protein
MPKFIKVTEQRHLADDNSWLSRPILLPVDKILAVYLFSDESIRNSEIVFKDGSEFVVETILELETLLNRDSE